MLNPKDWSSWKGATDSHPKPGDLSLGSSESSVLDVASLIVETKRSWGYCLELIFADFLAGRTEESSPEEILLLIHRLVKLLPADYPARLAGPLENVKLEPARKC